MADKNLNSLNFGTGDTYYLNAGNVKYDSSETFSDGTVGAALTQQSQQIAALDSSKADKLVEDARYKKQQTEIQFLLDAAKGQIAEVVTDDDEAYSKAVPAYTGGVAKFADVKKLGGKSVVTTNLLNPDFDKSILEGPYRTSSFRPVTKAYVNFEAILKQNKTIPNISFGLMYAESSIVWSVLNGVPKEDYYPIQHKTVSTQPNTRFVVYPNTEAAWDSAFDAFDFIAVESDTARQLPPYEPYFDGIISADCDVVVSQGKNLLNPNDRTNLTKNIYFNYTYGHTDYSFLLKAGVTYTLSVDSNQTTPSGIYMTPSLATVYDGHSVSFTPEVDTLAGFMIYYVTVPSEGIQNINVKLEVGSTATPYSPYMTAQLNIPAGLRSAHPLRSAGNAHDEYNVARKYTKVNVAHKEYDGSESWGGPENGNFFITANDAKRVASYKQSMTSNYAVSTTQGSLIYESVPAVSGYVESQLYPNANWIYIRVPNTATLNEVKTYLASHNLYLNYELATPIYYYDPKSPELAVNGGTVVPDATHIVDPESYFPDDTYLPVEDGGSLTFHQTSTEFPVPNTEDFYYTLEATA